MQSGSTSLLSPIGVRRPRWPASPAWWCWYPSQGNVWVSCLHAAVADRGLRAAHSPCRALVRRVKVDSHHYAPLGGCGDLAHAGVGEDAPASHVQLAPRDLHAGLRDHRVALHRGSAASTGELDGRLGERATDTGVAERRSCDEASDDPYAVVGAVLAALLAPGPLLRDQRERRARLDTAPADRLVADESQQPRGGIRLWVPAVGFLTQHLSPLRDGRRPPTP